MDSLISYVQHIFLYLANGALAVSYVVWENLTALGTLAAFLAFGWRAPTVQRGAIAAAGGVAVLAAAFAPPPVPVLLTAMAGVGVLAVAYDRFSPDALRWRVVGALALYAAGALAYLAYSYYLSGVDAAAWAEAIGGQAEAQTTLAQGRAFLNTLATWGLWLILPLGYLSLLAQGLLAHPPTGGRPETAIAQVRTRGR
jgi:prepilin signal peptidase PulO-like enzyme (type II secretory pathway)